MKRTLRTKLIRMVAGLSLLMGIVLGAGDSVEASAVKVDNDNNNIFKAIDINLNTEYIGNSSESYEEDWYHFVIPDTAKGSYFNVVLGADNVNSITIGSGWNFSLYRKGEADPFIYASGIKNESISNNIPFGPGEYYLVIKGNSSTTSSENYRFAINFTDNANWEAEYNDTWKLANPINVNETYHGNMFEWLDEDCYTFTISKPGEVEVKFGANPAEDITKITCGWQLSMYEENSASPVMKMTKVKAPAISEKYVLDAGTYRIRISGGGYGSYNPGNETYDFCVTYKELQKQNTTEEVKTSNQTIKTSNVKVASVKSKGKKKVYLKWKKNKYADGYKVYRSTKKKSGYKCIATIKKRSKVSYTDKKVKSKKVYYYKIRAYKKTGKTTLYSGYSTVKKVKVK